MASGSVSSALLVIFNIVYTILGLAITAASIWFFIEVYNVTSLRNANHYRLDYDMYWPQAIPWMFMFAGCFVLIVSCCGFVSAKKGKRSLVLTYVTFQSIALVLLLVSAIIALVFADSEASDKFLTDAIWDAFTNMKDQRSLESAFGKIERKYQCCGATSPRDYKGSRTDFPMSCCDTYTHGWQINPIYFCSITDKAPNERLGCAEVTTHHARIAVKVLAGAAIVTFIIGLFNLVSAVTLAKALKYKKPQQKVVGRQESESKKVLL